MDANRITRIQTNDPKEPPMQATKSRPPHHALQATTDPGALLRWQDVQTLFKLGRSTIFARVAAGKFPEPLRFSKRCTRWRRADVEAWLSAFKN